jgi:hypothetical protein
VTLVTLNLIKIILKQSNSISIPLLGMNGWRLSLEIVFIFTVTAVTLAKTLWILHLKVTPVN